MYLMKMWEILKISGRMEETDLRLYQSRLLFGIEKEWASFLCERRRCSRRGVEVKGPLLDAN